MLMRPKSDLNQLMYADCRLCSDMDKNNAVLCKFHSPVSILAKYMHRKRMFYLFAMHFWYGMTVYVYQNAQSVMVLLSVIHGERNPPLYACIEELCAH